MNIEQHKSLLNFDALEAVKVLLGALFLAACAQITIPLKTVPITLQTVGIMAIALTDRNLKTAMASVLCYLVLGIMGAPVFASHTFGLGVLLGHTGGYLLSFAPCTFVMHKISAHWGRNSLKVLFLNCLIGTVIIYVGGVAWLSTHLGIIAAITGGLLPFIIPGFIKAGILSIVLRTVGTIKPR